MSALFSSLPFDCPYPPDDRDPGPEVSRGERQQLLLRLLDGDHIVPSKERRYNDQWKRELRAEEKNWSIIFCTIEIPDLNMATRIAISP